MGLLGARNLAPLKYPRKYTPSRASPILQTVGASKQHPPHSTQRLIKVSSAGKGGGGRAAPIPPITTCDSLTWPARRSEAMSCASHPAPGGTPSDVGDAE
eukprot:1541410-Pyramimonas_sp.AAC.1